MGKEHLDNVERFEIAFNRIHSRLKELSHGSNSDRFVDLLQDNKDKYSAFKYNFHKLKQYAKLRNAIVHEKIDGGFYIAEPHINVVEEIERISDAVYYPPTVYSIASKPVIYFDTSTTLKDILHIIKTYGYTQYPVYGNGHFKGLITDGGIAKWFSEHLGENIEGTNAEHILKGEKRRNVACMPKNKTIYDLENIFEQFLHKKEKLEAVIITKNGDQDEIPLGIVTAWDLVKIDHSTTSLNIK